MCKQQTGNPLQCLFVVPAGKSSHYYFSIPPLGREELKSEGPAFRANGQIDTCECDQSHDALLSPFVAAVVP